MVKYRCRYSKGDNVKFISHLDMMQLFERAARRGGLPVAYSEGFNPRPMMVFGMPLPVGVTSDAEYVDISLDKELSCDEVIQILNSSFPEGVKILECGILGERSENIMRSVTGSAYIVEVSFSDISFNEGALALIQEFNTGRSLEIMKRSKSGEKLTDIRPMIISMSLENDKMAIETVAGNTMNLRPELAISALSAAKGINCTVKSIHRTRLIFSH